MQGVFFRASAAELAAKLELNGWIKNTKDEAVEAVVNGSEAALEQFIAWCNRGPKKAKVKNVQVTIMPDENMDGFQVIR